MYFSCRWLHKVHSIRIPANNGTPLDAQIAKQRSSSCAVAKDGIFHDRFARPNRLEEVVEVIVAIAVPWRGDVFFISGRRLSYRVRERVLLTVGFENLFLHRISECANCVPRLFLTRRAAYADSISG